MLNAMQYNLGMDKYLTTRQAAERLGVSEQAVRDLIRRQVLQAEKFGAMWVIHEEIINAFKPRKRGRPIKTE
jgi:excisionase family DNA binding protein